MQSLAARWTIPALFCLTACASFVGGCSDDDDKAKTPAADAGPGIPTNDAGADSATGNDAAVAQKDIVDTAVAAGGFTTLVAAVQEAGLEPTLRGAGPLTVFAPTDAAFGKLPKFLVDQLVTAPYKTELGLILQYHVLPGAIKAEDLLGKTSSPTTALGAKLAVDGNGGKVTVNGSVNVVTADVIASNGVIHAVDGVLLPTITDTAVGYADATTSFKTLVAALTAAELAATLGGPGPFTVFAPTDAAFAKVPKATLDSLLLPANKAQLQAILKYHVVAGAPVYGKDVAAGTVTTLGGPVTIAVSGGNVTLDAGGGAAKVVLTDLPTSNGVIHVIDTVILP